MKTKLAQSTLVERDPLMRTRNKAMHFFWWHSVKFVIVLCFVILFWVLWFSVGFCDSLLGFCDYVLGFLLFFFSHRPPYSTISSLREELVRNCPKGLEWNRNCKNQRNWRLVLKPSCTNSINQILVFQIKPICLIFLQQLSLIKGQELCSWRSKWLGVQYKLCEALNDITQLAAYN